MAQLKFSSNLFLGKQELERFKQFIDDDGFRKLFLEDSVSFGLFNNAIEGNFINFRIEQGTNRGTVRHAEGSAVDSDGNILFRDAEDNIAVPPDGSWYWMRIQHRFSSLETGTVSVDARGSVQGVDTEFRKVLRGANNNATKIKFINTALDGTVLNTGEYEVQTVISNTNIILNGNFTPQVNIKYAVVGSFPLDVSPPEEDKDVFQYDDTDISFEPEMVLATPPDIKEGKQFYIARVRNEAGVISINDVRSRYIYQSKSDYLRSLIDTGESPLIGVEQIQLDHPNNVRDKNLVQVSWTFRTSNWTFDPAINRITISDGLGGKFKSTDDFTDGDFNGWRLYVSEGKFFTIHTSTKAGSQINLDLGVADFDLLQQLNSTGNALEQKPQQLIVAPNAENVSIRFIPDSSTFQDIAEATFTFPINLPYARCPVTVFNRPSSSYVVRYKYKHGEHYAQEYTIPSDSVGYYNEDSFNNSGSLKTELTDRVRVPYVASNTSGFITLTLTDRNFAIYISNIIDDDGFGLQVQRIDNSFPNIILTPTISPRRLLIDHANDESPFDIIGNHFIELKKTDAEGNDIVNNGNSFLIDIRGRFTISNNSSLKVVTEFENPNRFTEILEIDSAILSKAPDNDLRLEFIYDGNRDDDDIDTSDDNGGWIYYEFNQPQESATPSGIAKGDLTGNYPNPKIAVNAVTSAKIADNAVTEDKIADNAVVGRKIGPVSITTEKIVNNAVTSAKIAANAVTASKIAANAVTASKIADGAVDEDKLSGRIDNNGNLIAPAVTSAKIAANAVTASKIADRAVTVFKIADGAVDEDKLSGRIDNNGNLIAPAVTSAKIAANAVTASKIADRAVTVFKIAANAVTASKIADNAVTAPKIATNAITSAKIAANAITNPTITVNAITASKIADNAVVASKIAANSVTASKIAANSVTADKLAANSVTADKLAANSVTGNNIQASGFNDERLFTSILPLTTNTFGLGTSPYRWSRLFSNQQTNVESDRRSKKNIESSDLGLTFIQNLQPVRYLMKEGDQVTHYGLIAQDIEELLTNEEGELKSFAGLDKDEENDQYSLVYGEFISPMIKAIQELSQQVVELKTEVNQLKERINNNP